MVSTPTDKMPNIRREDGCAHAFQHAVHRQNGDWSVARFQNVPRLQTRFQRPHRDEDSVAASRILAVAARRFQPAQSALQIAGNKKVLLLMLSAHGKTNRVALANPRSGCSGRTLSLRRGHPALAGPTTGRHPANGWASPGPASDGG